MVKWKYVITKMIIDSNIDLKGWFKVMCHTIDIYNHKSHFINQGNIPPMTMAKGDVGNITLLT